MHTLSHVVWGVSKHLAFAYLVYSLLQHRRGRTPTGRTTAVLLAGAVFPDLVDKTLMAVGSVGYGRTFAHSLFTTAVIVVAVGHLARRWNHADIGTAFGVGYLSHIPVDMYGPLLTGSQSMDSAFLFWPLAVGYQLGVPTPVVPITKNVVFGAVIVAAISLWLSDRLPLFADAIRVVSSYVDRSAGSNR